MKKNMMMIMMSVSLLVPSINAYAMEENYGNEEIFMEDYTPDEDIIDEIMPEEDYLLEEQFEEDGIGIEGLLGEGLIEEVQDSLKHPQMREGMPFSDVPSNAWYYNYVKRAYEYGHMDGQSSTCFNPDGQVTRAMALQMLYNLAGKPDVAYDGRFSDVSANDWYANAIAWGVTNGITSGTSSTTFSPNAIITRKQLCVFMYRYGNLMNVPRYTKYLQYNCYAFRDLQVLYWSEEGQAITWCVQHCIVQGTRSERYYHPNHPLGYYRKYVFEENNPVTRSQVAKMISILAIAEDDRLDECADFIGEFNLDFHIMDLDED